MTRVASVGVVVLTASLWSVLAQSVQADGPQDAGGTPVHVGQSGLLSLPNGDGPVKVRASFHLLDVNEISEEAETFEFSGVFTLMWRDPRLAFDPAETGITEKLYQGSNPFDERSPAWYPQTALVNTSGLYDTHALLLRVQPDGTCVLAVMIDAIAEAELDLRRYPFDRQRLEAIFEIFGFGSNEVVLEAGPVLVRPECGGIQVPQWRMNRVDASIRDVAAPYLGASATSSAFVLTVSVQREPFFILRLVALPLFLIVLLSFSVFWMDRSSLGDRMSITFVGILTSVAYQIVVGDIVPHISYITLMNAFLSLSFLIMCATVVANLMVGSLERSGDCARGDRLERRFRLVFPLVYLGLIVLVVAIIFTAF